MTNDIKTLLAVAPMMDWTDRHCRFFLRLISPHVILYSEMITTGALIHGDKDRFLRFHQSERPVVLQLGGNNAYDLALCAKMAEDYGYNEVNLNCGCPSDKVKSGEFGASLMSRPQLVANSVDAMRKAVTIPISVKCRIGIDNSDDLSFLNNFVEKLSNVGCEHIIVHARKAWLNGLSPKENRIVPPLRYDIVEVIKNKYPHICISLNGGLTSIEEVRLALTKFDGAMIGRKAYQDPYFLAQLETQFYKNQSVLPRIMVAHAMMAYIDREHKDYATPVKSITRHMLGLFKGQPGGAIWRRELSQNSDPELSNTAMIQNALVKMSDFSQMSTA